MIFLTVLCALLVSIFLYYFKPLKNYYLRFTTIRSIPGPPIKNIIVGNTYLLQTTPENIFKLSREWGRKFYPIYHTSIIHLAGANILSPEDFEAVLSNSKHNEKSAIYSLLHNWLGTGLLTSGGNKWLIRRKILTPAFHFSILQQFITIFNDETEKLIDILKKECHKPYIVVNPHIIQFTLKTIAETAMGTKLKFDTEKEMSYKKAILEMGDILLYRLTRAWFVNPILNLFSPNYLKERKMLKTLHSFTEEVIKKREETFQEVTLPTEEDEVYTGKRRLAMLDLLLTAKSKDGAIDHEGIREEVDTFMFEGHDTTAMALCFALMLLANHKDVQDKILEEMILVLDDIHKKPTYQEFQEMKYLERAIKEVLRLYPSVPFISRKLGDDIRSSSGHILPKDSICHLHVYDLHHNPDIYPDPEKFDPDRFLPENSQK